MAPPRINFLDVQTDFHANTEGVFQQSSQEIDRAFLDGLREARDLSVGSKSGEMAHVASIPAVLVEKWAREGFDLMSGNVTAREIVARLKAEGLDSFLATNRRV